VTACVRTTFFTTGFTAALCAFGATFFTSGFATAATGAGVAAIRGGRSNLSSVVLDVVVVV
jgi:hypothetical protein